ncbi:unnamed protein product [Cuscuta campestris]|uniref:K Homology domain-containing protein n=1 Tax=Cuscuta campestris TaxID=132261 RepID=A0A484NS15_9ASTE|nr:unnamed protein product [Cuscuta campestris]
MAGQSSSHGKRSCSQTQSECAENKRRNSNGGDKERKSVGSEETVYRYLCPLKKIGSIIGRGGEIIKQLREETKSKISIGETRPDCDERVVTIFGSREESNKLEGLEDPVCPAHDALLKVHDRVANDGAGDDVKESDEKPHVTAKLLVPSDQIGCIIGKGGQIVQSIRSETGAQIRILKDKHLPACALASDELVQISGEMPVVSKALHQVATRLHSNPSRSQHLLADAAPSVYPSRGGLLMGPAPGSPIVRLAPLLGPYVSYKDKRGEWPQSLYTAPRHESSSTEFSLRLICPNVNVGGVIGKGGAIINKIRQDSRASIKVDISSDEEDDCLIVISAKESFEDTYSPTIEAALLLQPRCSEKVDKDSGLSSFTTRLLVPSSCIGCLIGKGGSIINGLRKITKANIRILSRESLPKVAAEDDEMVLISGEPDVSKDALIQVTSRLRADLFEREGAVSAFATVPSYLPMPIDVSDSLTKYESRDSRMHGRGLSYSSGYNSASDLPCMDGYGSYSSFQRSTIGSPRYGAYDGYSLGRSAGLSEPSSALHRKSYGF